MKTQTNYESSYPPPVKKIKFLSFAHRVFLFSTVSLLALTSFGCKENPKKLIEHEKVDSTFVVPKEEMLAKCADLKGLGPFVIGKTTLKEVNNSKIFDSMFNETDFSGGKWRAYEENAEKALENHKRIKMFHNAWHFKIGEVEFDDISMAFVDNVLVAIYFDPHSENTLLSSYISKYGSGEGQKHIDSYLYKDPSYNDTHHNEERTWYNDRVTLRYTTFFTTKPLRADTEFIIHDNTGKYQYFIDEIESANEIAKKERETKTKQSYNEII